jgi:hypothetical protein
MFKCKNCKQELTDEIRFDLGWHCDYPCDTVTHDEDVQPERLNPEACDHSGINIMEYINERCTKCSKCNSTFTRCDSPNSENK